MRCSGQMETVGLAENMQALSHIFVFSRVNPSITAEEAIALSLVRKPRILSKKQLENFRKLTNVPDKQMKHDTVKLLGLTIIAKKNC